MKFHEWNDSTTSRTQDEEFEIHQILFGGKPLEMHGKNAFPFEVGRSLKKTHQEQVADMCGLGKKNKKTTTFVRIGKKNKVDFLFDLLDSFSCLNISDFAATTNSLFEKPPFSKSYTGFESNWTLFMSWGARKKAYKCIYNIQYKW